MTSILLVSGFRGMGKDYIVNHGYHGYTILQHRKRVSKSLPDPTNLTRMKFATPLRKLLNGYFTPDSIDAIDFEHHKDDPDFLPYNGTLRQLFIEIARATRLVDQDFYAKRLDMELTDQPAVVTDWRYPNEYDYLAKHNHIVTLRVHREYDHHGKRINIPNDDDNSEHSLDNFKTDFIAIPNKYFDESYNGLLKRFSWANKYLIIQ